MKKNLTTALLMTIVTTILLGIGYPLLITGLARIFPDQRNGQLIKKNGVVIGSRIIGQMFASPQYFHGRPSAAATAGSSNGYDPTNSAGSNLGPTNQKLIDQAKSYVAALQAENPGTLIPVDLVTMSGSGLDPHISPTAPDFQVPRVAKARGTSANEVAALIARHTQARQYSI